MAMKGFLKKLRHRSFSPRRNTDKPTEDSRSRDSSSTTPTQVDERRTGLFLLNNQGSTDHIAKDLYNVDIVVVHGLNGHFKRTWTHSNGTCWPQDLLPQTFPGARIFSYEYPSRIFASRSVAGIRDFAKQLLSCLDLVRVEDECSRPIIYICHSLGGIVVKQAMITAYQLEEFRNIWLGSKAIIFMGTPHRGSPDASYGKVLGDIANAVLHMSGTYRFIGGVNTALIENLGQESKELMGIAEDFVARASSLQIISFYETEKHPLTNKVVVGQPSAVLGLTNERTRPLYVNHQDLCRFSGPQDESYHQVSQTIKAVIKVVLQENETVASSLNTDRSYDETEKICVSLLNTTDIASYESRLDVRVEGTLNWVLNNTQYTTWASDPNARILWVTGHAGCGKTILASYIMRYLTDHLPPRALVCRFFCDNKHEELCDASALLRSLIFQILDRRRRLWRLVKKASDAGGLHIFRQFDALWNLFVQITRAERGLSITIIIDAIDECDKNTQLLIISRISAYMGFRDMTSVKFFITSRPDADAALEINVSSKQLIQLRLEEKEDQISSDIKLVVRHRLELIVKRGACKPAVRDVIEQMLIAKADRTFLWIKLVLPLLEERRLLFSTDIKMIAAQLPSDLVSLYSHLLSSIPKDDCTVAARMLRLLVSSDRPLTGEELGILMTIGPEHSSTSSLNPDQLPLDQYSARSALGPLVRIYGTTIELVHQSLKDYLVWLNHQPQDTLASTFGVDIIRDKLALFSACSLYLALDDFSQNILATEGSSKDNSPINEVLSSSNESLYAFDLYEEPMFKENLFLDEQTWARTIAEYKLFDYAALHWAADFSKCNESVSEQHHIAALALCKANTAQLENWFRYFWFKNMHPEPFPFEVDALMIVSFFGHVNTLLRLLLDTGPSDVVASTRALYWAARNGQTLCVDTLLRHQHIDFRGSEANIQTPLSVAAQFGHLECVSILSKDVRVDVNAKDRHGRTPLSLAVSNNHAEIIALLLAHDGVSVDLPDNNLSTPLHWAVATQSCPIISQLLSDERINENHLDKQGRSALSWAAEYGAADVVQLLIRSQHIEIGQKDPRGRTPLSYAAQHGHLDILKHFIKSKRVDLLDGDKDCRNAHSWAAAQRESSVLRYLIKQCRAGADVEDIDGWTPLAWALNPPGYPDNVLALLQLGSVNVNHKDRIHGRTALSWSASYGYTQISRYLLRIDGIELECRDINGQTPLSDAATSGNVDIVRLLLDTNMVDINSRDKNGRTSLSWAAREGHDEVVAILLSNSAVDAYSKDNMGQTALDVAKAFRRENIVLAIQQWRPNS